MLVLVAFIGWLVVRYTRTYLDGEAGQGRFTGWLCAALSMVLVLVQSGNLLLLAAAWIGIGFCLHRLLLFYPDRPGARRACAQEVGFGAPGRYRPAGGPRTAGFQLRHRRYRSDQPGRPRRTGRPGRNHCRSSAGIRRRREIRPVSAPRLADRGHGNAHAGLGAAARRHHQCRRFLADPPGRCLASHAGRAGRSGHDRRLHGGVREPRDAHPIGGQDLPGLVDDCPDGLHDHAVRSGIVFRWPCCTSSPIRCTRPTLFSRQVPPSRAWPKLAGPVRSRSPADVRWCWRSRPR